MNIKPNKQYIYVEIDKAAQKAKQEKTPSGIYLAPKYNFMRYNLQYGDVLAIGDNVSKLMPEMQVGDIAIFNHKVESGAQYLIDVLPNGNEVRAVMVDPVIFKTELLYGVLKFDDDGKSYIIPYPKYCFFEPESQKVEPKVVTSLLVPEDMWKDPLRLERLLKELQREFQTRNHDLSLLNGNNPGHKRRIDDNLTRMNDINREVVKINAFLKAVTLVRGKALYVHPKTVKTHGIHPNKDHMFTAEDEYLIDFFGNHFKVYDCKYIIGRFV